MKYSPWNVLIVVYWSYDKFPIPVTQVYILLSTVNYIFYVLATKCSYSKLAKCITVSYDSTTAMYVHSNTCTCLHENSVGVYLLLPIPNIRGNHPLPAQANLTQQKAEPLRCLAFRTRVVG